MKIPGTARARKIADEKIIQPVKQAIGIAIAAIVIALVALIAAVSAI